jgi:rRNA-processing protein EBP2
LLNAAHKKVALERIRDTIKLDSSMPWTETLVLSYPEKIEVDVEDDLNREVALYALIPSFHRP